jgi:hypothetical protein
VEEDDMPPSLAEKLGHTARTLRDWRDKDLLAGFPVIGHASFFCWGWCAPLWLFLSFCSCWAAARPGCRAPLLLGCCAPLVVVVVVVVVLVLLLLLLVLLVLVLILVLALALLRVRVLVRVLVRFLVLLLVVIIILVLVVVRVRVLVLLLVVVLVLVLVLVFCRPTTTA